MCNRPIYVIVTVVCAPDVAEIAAMFGVVVVGFIAVVASIVFVVVVIYVFCRRLCCLVSVELQTGLRHKIKTCRDARVLGFADELHCVVVLCILVVNK